MYLFYTLGNNPILLYFVAQIVPALATERSLTYPIIVGLNFSSTSLLSGTKGCSQLILCIPCPGPRISPFSTECLSLLLENGLGAGCALCS